jgi:hypothetical protein
MYTYEMCYKLNIYTLELPYLFLVNKTQV